MRIQFSRRALFETTWYEYALRFLFGGLVTVAAGIIAKQFGPAIGGLFLAFPAIFPASATMIQTQQENKKKRLGLRGGKRAARAVSADAAGAAMGSIGLAVFALIVWRTLPTHTLLHARRGYARLGSGGGTLLETPQGLLMRLAQPAVPPASLRLGLP